MEERVFNLVEESRSFATRMRGKEIVRLVAELIEETPERVLVVNWEGVNAASPSFVDEFVRGIQAFMDKDPDRSSIVFEGLNPYIAGIVDAVLCRREVSVKHIKRIGTLDCGSAEVLGYQGSRTTMPV